MSIVSSANASRETEDGVEADPESEPIHSGSGSPVLVSPQCDKGKHAIPRLGYQFLPTIRKAKHRKSVRDLFLPFIKSKSPSTQVEYPPEFPMSSEGESSSTSVELITPMVSMDDHFSPRDDPPADMPNSKSADEKNSRRRGLQPMVSLATLRRSFSQFDVASNADNPTSELSSSSHSHDIEATVRPYLQKTRSQIFLSTMGRTFRLRPRREIKESPVVIDDYGACLSRMNEEVQTVVVPATEETPPPSESQWLGTGLYKKRSTMADLYPERSSARRDNSDIDPLKDFEAYVAEDLNDAAAEAEAESRTSSEVSDSSDYSDATIQNRRNDVVRQRGNNSDTSDYSQVTIQNYRDDAAWIQENLSISASSTNNSITSIYSTARASSNVFWEEPDQEKDRLLVSAAVSARALSELIGDQSMIPQDISEF